MRYLIFSDIHGNIEAFEALMKFKRKHKIDHYICLGDLVGYGASPNEIIDGIKALEPLSIIRGNHDKAACDPESIKSFNPIAASAIFWTQQNITKENLKYLCGLKKGPMRINDSTTICHGAPFDEDYYIFGEFDAAEAFLHLETKVNFFGHTHYPFIYKENDHLVEGIFLTRFSQDIKLQDNFRYLINPGSVGQPRDRNTKSACAIYDSSANKISFHRVAYDIAKAQKKIKEAGLPPALAERLNIGI